MFDQQAPDCKMPQDKEKLKIFPQSITISLVSAVLITLLYLAGIFENLENLSYDAALRLRGKQKTSQIVILIAIDEASLQKFGPWPWPRRKIARIIQAASRAGAEVIGVDIGFFEPGPNNSPDDQTLISATRESGRVIFPVYIASQPSLGKIVAFQRPFPALARAAAGMGHAHIEPSLDGVVRKMYLLQRCGGEELPAFPVRIIQEFLSRQGLNSRLKKERNQLRIGELSIPSLSRSEHSPSLGSPIQQDYLTYIPYSGPTGSYLTLSAWKVLEPDFPLPIFRHKIVLLGGTAAGLFDQAITPFSTTRKPMPAIEIQANMIDGILSQNLISRIPSIWVVLSIFVVSLGTGLLFYYLGTAGSLLAGGAVFGGIGGGYLLLLYRVEHWWDIWPLLAVTLLNYLVLNARKLGVLFSSLDREIKTLTRIKKSSLPVEEPASEKELLQRLSIFLNSLLNIQAVYLLRIDGRRRKSIITTMSGEGKPPDPYPLPPTWKNLTEPRIIPSSGPDSPFPGGLLCPWRRREDLLGFFLFRRSSREPFEPPEIKFCQQTARQLADTFPISRAKKRSARPTGSIWRFLHRGEMVDKIENLNLLSHSIGYEQALLSSILTSITEAVIVSDSLGNIILANARARKILQLSPLKLKRLNIFSLLKDLSRLPAPEIRKQFFPGEGNGKIFPLEIKLNSNFYLLSLAGIGGQGQVAAGLMAVLSDITHLKQLDQLRTDTVSILTHEIKNPLAGIMGYCELLMGKTYQPDKLKEDLKLIHLSALKIHQLVGDYLAVARLESGREEVILMPVDLGELIKQEIALLLPTARRKGIQLESDLPVPLPKFRGDLNLLDRAFTNLITNAIKYSPSDKTVRVVLSHIDGSFVFQVEDQGFGIPPADREKIFEKFYRGKYSRIREIPGTGLGLTITREIINRHGGKISVESTPGEGSTFTVILPDKIIGKEEKIA